MDSRFKNDFLGTYYANQKARIEDTPFTVLASPSWRGVDAEIFLVKLAHTTHLAKVYYAESQGYIDIACAFQAATLAGQLNIAPKVMIADVPNQTLTMKYLGKQWRTAGLQDLVNVDIRTQIIAAKKKFQQQASSLISQPSQQIFQQIEDLAAAIQSNSILAPKKLQQWLQFNQKVQQQIRAAGIDLLPCHRDGNISNIMIGPNQEIKLLDYDLAAQADPLEDIGCFLMEAFEAKSDAQAGFEQWQGYFDAAQFERAWTYGILDDLRWGLIALNVAAHSPRTALEFGKYGSWRLMRFEENLAAVIG